MYNLLRKCFGKGGRTRRTRVTWTYRVPHRAEHTEELQITEVLSKKEGITHRTEVELDKLPPSPTD